MFTKNTWIVSLVLSSALLTACQGENTFTRNSDPYPQHKALYESAQPYDAGRPTPDKSIPVPVQQTQGCTEPFKMTIEGSKDNGQTLEFVAGVEKSVTIKVESRLPSDRKWDVRPVITPCADCFSTVEKNASSATYKFKWKPKQALLIQDQYLVLRYDFLMDVRCQNSPANPNIALIVKASESNEPAVSISGLPSKPIVFGSEPVKVVLQITDPKGSSKKAPDVDSISYKFDGAAVNSKISALDCEDKGTEVQTTDGQQAWAFNCSLETKSLVSQKQLNKLSGSGKTVEAEVSVKAQSKATKLYSEVSTAKLQVLFEKIEKTALTEKVGE